MDDFTRYALDELIRKGREAGVPAEVLDPVTSILHEQVSAGGRLWAAAHPDLAEDSTGCCWGDIQKGAAGCTCWVEVYDVEQAPPARVLASAADACSADARCGDCAFRRGSPEMADEWTRDALLGAADKGVPFWCHQGMRRPARWEHPDGRVVDGSPDDWQPLKVAGVPYQADGAPALLCAGWVARTSRAGGAER